MLYDYNSEPDSGSPSDRWVSLESTIVEEMALIIDASISKHGAIGTMRRRHQIFDLVMKDHPEAKDNVTHYFWEGLRLQKNRFDWPENHPMKKKDT